MTTALAANCHFLNGRTYIKLKILNSRVIDLSLILEPCLTELKLAKPQFNQITAKIKGFLFSVK